MRSVPAGAQVRRGARPLWLVPLGLFGASSPREANDIMRQCPVETWELLFVAICECRQAWQCFKDDGAQFTRIVQTVGAHPCKHGRTIRRYTKLLVKRGVMPRKCFSTRIIRALRKNLS